MTTTNFENIISSCIPMPVCMINSNGKITSANDKIGEVFIYDAIIDADIFTLTGVKTADLYEAAKDHTRSIIIKRNDRIFKLMCQTTSDEEDSHLTILFSDVTGFEELKEMYNNEKLCIGKIQIDNYDELMANTPLDERVSVPNEIDKIVRKWAEKINGAINRIKDDAYVVSFEQSQLEKLISSESNFSIL